MARKKSFETKDTDAVSETMMQIDGELEAEAKKKRIRREKKQIILDKVKDMYCLRTESDVFKKELDKISASLDAMENAKTEKKKISEADVLSLFTVEQLQEMIAKKQAN